MDIHLLAVETLSSTESDNLNTPIFKSEWNIVSYIIFQDYLKPLKYTNVRN